MLLSSVNTQLVPVEAEPSLRQNLRGKEEASYLLLPHLPPAAEDLHSPSTSVCNVEPALVSAF